MVVVVERHWAWSKSTLGGLDSPPACEYWCGWRTRGDPTGTRLLPAAFEDGWTEQSHWWVSGSVPGGDWDVPCSTGAAASGRKTGR